MSSPALVVSHAPEDIHVLGGESLSFRVLAESLPGTKPDVGISVSWPGYSDSFPISEVSSDYSRRVVSSSHGVILQPSAGLASIRTTVSSSGYVGTTLTNNIKVFETADTVYQITDNSSLNTAISNINSGSDSHYLLSFAAGTYSVAEATALTREDDVLVSFEPDVGALNNVIFDGVINSKGYFRWGFIEFANVASEPCARPAPGSVHVFDTCKFDGGSHAVLASGLSSVRVVDSHCTNCTFGFRGVSVVRGCSADTLNEAFAYDCPVVIGNIATFTTSGRAMVRLTSGFIGRVAVCDNTLVDQQGVSLLSSNGVIQSSIICGNIANGTADDVVDFGDIRNSYVGNNSWQSTANGSNGLVIRGQVSSNIFSNNWISPLTREAIKAIQFKSEWKNNATESSTDLFPGTLTELTNQFSNNYMFLKKQSSLAKAGGENNLIFAQGSKNKGQIGALPYTADTDLTYVHRSVIDRPFFNFSGPTPVIS